MKKLLIADADKISILSTTEIFKDYCPGIKISIAHTAKEALQIIQNNLDFDAFIIDFDLPDSNGVNAALKLTKFSKNPIFITGFGTPDVFDAMTRVLPKFQNIYQNFLKKPLQADVVRAVFDQNFNSNAKERMLPTNLIALVRYGSAKNQCFVPVVIKECGLSGLSVVALLSSNQQPVQSNGISLCMNKELRVNAKVILNCLSLNAIELGQTVNIRKMFEMTKNELFDTFSFELKGKIIEENKEKQTFRIECDDITSIKKIFEAVSFHRMNQQLKHQLTLLHV